MAEDVTHTAEVVARWLAGDDEDPDKPRSKWRSWVNDASDLIRRLDEEDLEIVSRRDYGLADAEELAPVLGCSPDSVGTAMHRAGIGSVRGWPRSLALAHAAERPGRHGRPLGSRNKKKEREPEK